MYKSEFPLGLTELLGYLGLSVPKRWGSFLLFRDPLPIYYNFQNFFPTSQEHHLPKECVSFSLFCAYKMHNCALMGTLTSQYYSSFDFCFVPE